MVCAPLKSGYERAQKVFWTSGAKVSQGSCTAATSFGTNAKDFSLLASKRPFAPSRSHFRQNTPSTAGNSMTGSERPSPEPLLKKRRPQPYWGGENSGNALEASNAFSYRAWGIAAVLSRGIPGNALRAFPGSFRNSSRISSGKSQPYWGYGPFREFLFLSPSPRLLVLQDEGQKSAVLGRCLHWIF